MNNTYFQSLFYTLLLVVSGAIVTSFSEESSYVLGNSLVIIFLVFCFYNFDKKFKENWKENILLIFVSVATLLGTHIWVTAGIFIITNLFLEKKNEKIFIAAGLIIISIWIGNGRYTFNRHESNHDSFESNVDIYMQGLDNRIENLEENY